MTCCAQQDSETYKLGSDACFTCLGCSQPKLLEPGFHYPTCSPLVQGETKLDPLRPMSAPDECIVAFVGPCCSIDATEWTEACEHHVYPEAKAIKQCINWPEDEEGNSILSVEDIELICHAHSCCISFDSLKECAQAPEWIKEFNTDAVKKSA